jgi:hypothetical protein
MLGGRHGPVLSHPPGAIGWPSVTDTRVWVAKTFLAQRWVPGRVFAIALFSILNHFGRAKLLTSRLAGTLALPEFQIGSMPDFR